MLVRGALVLVLVIAVVVAVGLLVPGAARRLGSADPAWLAPALVLEAAALASYVALFHSVFARPPDRLRLRRSAEIALGELAGFALVPAGAGAPVVRLWGLRGGEMAWRTIGVRSVVFGVLFNLPYVSVALAFGVGVAVGALPGSAPIAVALAPLGLVVCVLLVIAVVAASARSRWIAGTARWKQNTRAVLALVPAGIRELPWFGRRPSRAAGALGFWAFDCAVLWAALQACGGSPALAVVVLAYMLGQLGGMLPLPGGVGGVEPLMLGIFVASGVDSGLAAAGIVCYRAVSLGLQSVAGVVAVASLVPAVRRERREREPRPPRSKALATPS